MVQTELRRKRQVAQRKKQQRQFRVIAVSLCMVAAIVLLVIYLGRNASASDLDSGRVKYYTGIQIKEGDSLWSIAEAYISKEYDSVGDYIDELKKVNQLKNDKIYEGKYLIVPYYK